jgi:hypothetical protein
MPAVMKPTCPRAPRKPVATTPPQQDTVLPGLVSDTVEN